MKKLIGLMMLFIIVVFACACENKEPVATENTGSVGGSEVASSADNIIDQIASIGSENAEVEIEDYVLVAETDFEWEESEEGITLTAYTGTNTAVELPSEINGKPVIAIGNGCFVETSVVAVRTPDSVKRIGYQAFMFVMTLAEVELGSGTEVIEMSAFEGCSALRSIRLNEGIHTIEGRAFAMCSVLNDITLPSTLTTLGAGAFCLASGLESITIPGGVTVIDEQTFTTCSALKEVIVENGVTEIKYGAFEVCDALEIISLPTSLTTISTAAFNNSNHVTIIAAGGSAAETYANENGIAFANQ